jgi:hypothetical protein
MNVLDNENSSSETEFRAYRVKSEDILMNLTNDCPYTPLKIIQAIRSKLCEQFTGDNFKVGVYMVRYILATNHYSLPWICLFIL